MATPANIGASVTNSNNPLSNPIDPMIPVKRGKMGPRGEKGDKGNPGEKGADLSVEIDNLEGNIARLEEENSIFNKTTTKLKKMLSTQRTKFDLLEQEKNALSKTTLSQAVKIQDLQDLLEHEKNEMNNTIFSQTNRIQLLESLLYKQIERISVSEALSECQLPDITNISPQISRRVPNNATVQLSCSRFFPQTGVTKRRCFFGKFHPNFQSHPFSCDSFYTTWEKANKVCKDLGTTLISDGIDTTEKRKSTCIEYGATTFVHTGIEKSSGSWRYPDGRSLNSFEFDWKRQYTNRGSDYMKVVCTRGRDFGKLINLSRGESQNFLC